MPRPRRIDPDFELRLSSQSDSFRIVNPPPPSTTWDEYLFERPTSEDLAWERWNSEWWDLFGSVRPFPAPVVQQFHRYMDMAHMLGFATPEETKEIEELHSEDLLPF